MKIKENVNFRCTEAIIFYRSAFIKAVNSLTKSERSQIKVR